MENPYAKLKFRVKAACRIVGIDPQRFNEAVAAGHYGCAPEVARGATRLMDYNDLVALFFYRTFLDQEFPPRLAGLYACRIRSRLDDLAEDEGDVMLLRYFNNRGEVLVENRLPANQRPPRAEGLLQRFSFDVVAARQVLDKLIAEELSIIGEDD
ncbi:hypothetical protein GWI72_01005 [Microvirga tunisiensis]|uniref:Uncharacterized protein n=1 Tax=Pannonibacter tanglangensis TaxID=2750084 RepID=A0A7X5EZ91_9HYPH|nr:hypothetical protein [Pannonibacter sp. XCT-53]NBN76841.1 hypothetical protein [Pannonibacter sp. XCT-53]